MKLKLYQTVDHSQRNTRYAYVCASSKNKVAEILNTTLSQLNKYGCAVLKENEAKYSRYQHLKEGEVAFEDPHQNHVTKDCISDRDLHRISAIGYLDAAIHALNNCQLPDSEMKERLHQIQGDLKELKIDTNEALRHKYGGWSPPRVKYGRAD